MRSLELELKNARKKKAIGQSVIQKKLGLTSQQYISNWERGLCPLAPKHFADVSKILNVPLKKMIRLRLKDEKAILEKTVGLK